MSKAKRLQMTPLVLALMVLLAGGSCAVWLRCSLYQQGLQRLQVRQHTVIVGSLNELLSGADAVARLLANDGHFVKEIRWHDLDAMLHRIVPLHEIAGFSVVNVYLPDGELVAKASEAGVYRRADELRHLVVDAIRRPEGVSTITMYEGRLMALSFKPIGAEGRWIGVLAVGREIDSELVGRVGSMVDSQLAFEYDGKLVVACWQALADAKRSGGLCRTVVPLADLPVVGLEHISAVVWSDGTARLREVVVQVTVLTVLVLIAIGGLFYAERSNRTRSRLEVAREAAEAASRTKSEFLANMSHEIRTPMTAIMGFADVLMEEQSRADRLECIETIRRNGQHLLAIINDILDLSKIESGRMTVEKLPCDPQILVDDVVALLRVRAEAKGLQLVVAYAREIPASIITDPTRLRQILVNVIGNAVKFTDSGAVTVKVAMRDSLSVPRPRMLFEVVDTGIGMTDKQLEHLFRPFSQGDESVTRRFGGTGLGLAICQRLARLLGGEVTVSSVAGQGSVFRVTVEAGPSETLIMVKPRCQTHTQSPARPQELVPVRLPLEGLRILLAEDGLDNQRLIKHVLIKAGASVELAENGRRAVEAAQRAESEGKPHDVVLMDMQMPELDGYGAVALLRSQGYRRPIIALTAHAMAEDRDRCIGAGCDDYAPKPINKGRLTAMVAAHAAGAKAAGAGMRLAG